MSLLEHLFGFAQKPDTPELLSAIERAVCGVEPLLRHVGRYPGAYRKPVMSALEYARSLALSLPDPVEVNLASYASDAYVHAIFPSTDVVSEAFRSSRAIQDYLREQPSSDEVYALMGMRRREKTTMGMELSGQLIQRDVPQHIVYFSSHTIENPAPSEAQARERVAWNFFDSLVAQVAKRVASRKQKMQSQLQEKDLLMARLHVSDAGERPALQEELSGMLARMQAVTRSLDLHNYLDDFKAVLLDPEQYLRLNQTSMILDSMGIIRDSDSAAQGKAILFNDLIGFDRRDWTVTMVHCRDIRDIQGETFATRLETAYRSLGHHPLQ